MTELRLLTEIRDVQRQLTYAQLRRQDKEIAALRLYLEHLKDRLKLMERNE